MNRREANLYRALNPKAPAKSRQQIAEDALLRRLRESENARWWLFTAESLTPIPYGHEWNREYNSQPYPEAKPDPEEYAGTGIGCLYGFPGSERHSWQLAGWNLVRTGAEQRARRK